MVNAEQSLIKVGIHKRLTSMEKFFNRSTRGFREEDSSFSPSPGMFTTAQHVAHTAQVVDWYVKGAFAPAGFEMNFEKLENEIHAVTSLAAARTWLNRAFSQAHTTVDMHSDEEWAQHFPPGAIMGNRLRLEIIVMLTDHVAHHRGALTVYSRLLGKVPSNPYMDPM
jgi:uncharacterized damage-inducible protein DinB